MAGCSSERAMRPASHSPGMIRQTTRPGSSGITPWSSMPTDAEPRHGVPSAFTKRQAPRTAIQPPIQRAGAATTSTTRTVAAMRIVTIAVRPTSVSAPTRRSGEAHIGVDQARRGRTRDARTGDAQAYIPREGFEPGQPDRGRHRTRRHDQRTVRGEFGHRGDRGAAERGPRGVAQRRSRFHRQPPAAQGRRGIPERLDLRGGNAQRRQLGRQSCAVPPSRLDRDDEHQRDRRETTADRQETSLAARETVPARAPGAHGDGLRRSCTASPSAVATRSADAARVTRAARFASRASGDQRNVADSVPSR